MEKDFAHTESKIFKLVTWSNDDWHLVSVLTPLILQNIKEIEQKETENVSDHSDSMSPHILKLHPPPRPPPPPTPRYKFSVTICSKK